MSWPGPLKLDNSCGIVVTVLPHDNTRTCYCLLNIDTIVVSELLNHGAFGYPRLHHSSCITQSELTYVNCIPHPVLSCEGIVEIARLVNIDVIDGSCLVCKCGIVLPYLRNTSELLHSLLVKQRTVVHSRLCYNGGMSIVLLRYRAKISGIYLGD